MLHQPVNLFNFLTSCRDHTIGLKHCLGAGRLRVCLCCRAGRAPWICSRLVMMRTAAVRNTGPWEPGVDRGGTQEVSRMKYDLNVHGEMGKVTLGVYSVSPCKPSRHRGPLRPGSDVSGKNFNVYRLRLSRRGAGVAIALPRQRNSWPAESSLLFFVQLFSFFDKKP